MPDVRLSKPAIVALREIRAAEDRGTPIRMYGQTGGAGFWCSGVKQTTTTMKELLGFGMANVVDAVLTCSGRGRDYIEGLP